MREPLLVKHLRKKAKLAPTSDIGVLMAYLDQLSDALEAAGDLRLTDEQVLQAAGPPTHEVGGQPVWELSEQALHRLAHALLAAAMRDCAG